MVSLYSLHLMIVLDQVDKQKKYDKLIYYCLFHFCYHCILDIFLATQISYRFILIPRIYRTYVSNNLKMSRWNRKIIFFCCELFHAVVIPVTFRATQLPCCFISESIFVKFSYFVPVPFHDRLIFRIPNLLLFHLSEPNISVSNITIRR